MKHHMEVGVFTLELIFTRQFNGVTGTIYTAPLVINILSFEST